jgi:hypothetical protein
LRPTVEGGNDFEPHVVMNFMMKQGVELPTELAAAFRVAATKLLMPEAKPKGHLDYDLEMQQRANEIAAKK